MPAWLEYPNTPAAISLLKDGNRYHVRPPQRTIGVGGATDDVVAVEAVDRVASLARIALVAPQALGVVVVHAEGSGPRATPAQPMRKMVAKGARSGECTQGR
jgi:hypothetical protein